MKKILDIVIFLLLIILIGLANQRLFGISFSNQAHEKVQFAPELNVTKILYSNELAPKIMGYGGHVPMAIGIDEQGIIKDIKMLSNNETPEFFNQAISSGILNNWMNKSVETAKNIKVDAVSGATISSTAIIKNMQQMLGNKTDIQHYKTSDIIKSLAVLFVGLLGLFSFFTTRKSHRLRLFICTISIFILGIWQGSMLSIAKISSWLIYGIPDFLQWPLIFIFLMSILIPLKTGKNFYCQHVCPFGCAQDLMAQSIQLKIKVKTYHWLSYCRFVMLLICFIMMIFSLTLYIGNIEPFSAFKPEFAPISAICIFAGALIVSTFMPRAWCKYLCPCGAFLDLFKRKK